jgi:hypothetical protein
MAAIALLLSCEKEVSLEVGKEADMPVVNGVMRAPISVWDVAQMLGVNSGDVGYLCSNRHGKINKWSKYKPVIFQAFDNLDANWYKAKDGRCGLIVPLNSNDLPGLISFAKKNNYDYQYQPPQGGIASPYRISDFNGYNHYAINPFGSFSIPFAVYTGYGKATIEMRMIEVADSNLKISDIFNFDDWYPGIAMYYDGSYYWCTGYYTLGEYGSIVSFDAEIGELTGGTYNVYPILSSVKKPSISDIVNTEFTYIPTQPKDMYIISGYPFYISLVISSASSDGMSVNYELTIASLNGDQTLSNCYIDIRYEGRTPSDPSNSTDRRIYLNDIQTTEAQQTFTGTVPLSIRMDSITGCWFVSIDPEIQFSGAILS